MIFDIFHSLGRVDSVVPRVDDMQVFRDFFEQARAADAMGFKTMWVAESHFSTAVQRQHRAPVLSSFEGEIGLNTDSTQLAHALFERTDEIGFGTAIFNIVGGNGGPIAAADRVRALATLNAMRENPRALNIGIGSGRFSYVNQPFGIAPRNPLEQIAWKEYQRFLFLEALEIFLRLSRSEVVSSDALEKRHLTRELFSTDETWELVREAARPLRLLDGERVTYQARWAFDPLKLVPELSPRAEASLRFVLGSSDPMALDVAVPLADIDLFQLSFTSPGQLDAYHAEMTRRYASIPGRTWSRARMPRTVLVFIDTTPERAARRASDAVDTYLRATLGTISVPKKEELLTRALIGDAAAIRDQLVPGGPHGFDAGDRLMLWFEYNQSDSNAIITQMRDFADSVMPQLTHAP